MPEILYSSIFGALTQHVQARFDAASKLHKQLFDNVIFERFLDWDTPTIGLDFEEIIGQYNITVAAPTGHLITIGLRKHRCPFHLPGNSWSP